MLHIEPTKSTPRVILDPQEKLLSIGGQSYPENAFKFFEPIIAALDSFLTEGRPGLRVEFALHYINTSSSKCLMTILDRLEEASKAGKQISLTWYVNPENESEQECAEEFQEDITFPFNIVVAGA